MVLIGNKEVTCLNEGQWSSPFPICEGIQIILLPQLTDTGMQVQVLIKETKVQNQKCKAILYTEASMHILRT